MRWCGISPVHSDSPFCHNCGIRLTGPFCGACGQKDVPLTVTLHDFFHDLTHEILHVDGRILQTIRRLLLSPGFLTSEYIQGRRARWIAPIRLYLIFSVMFFALSAFTGFRGMVRETRREGGVNISVRNPSQTGITADDKDAEDEIKALGFESVAALQDAVNHAVLAWVPRVMFVLLPLFAWLAAVAYRKVDGNYLHHLIFAVHVHAAWFAAGAVARVAEVMSRPLGEALEALLLVFLPIYAVLAFRRVYGKISRSIARIAFVLVAYLLAVVVALAVIVVPVVFHRFWTNPF
jgi:hypothetical protein